MAALAKVGRFLYTERMSMKKKIIIIGLVIITLGIGGYILTVNWGSDAPTWQDIGTLPPQAGLPVPVEATRQAIYNALQKDDHAALGRLIKPTQFKYTFGENIPAGPIAYWQEQRKEGPRDPFMEMKKVLTMPYDKQLQYYVWPGVFVRGAEEWTAEDKETLKKIATTEEIKGYRNFGAYIGYRVGIREDGTWVYFIAGD